MSNTIFIDPSIIESSILLEKRLLTTSLSSPTTLSLQTSTTDNVSVETQDLEGRLLGSSESSECPKLREVSSSLLALKSFPSSSLEKRFQSGFKEKQHSKLLQAELNILGCQQNILEFCLDEYLRFLEPTPVLPPPYETLPPGGCPRFPVLDVDPTNVGLPSYSPSAYKLGLVYRKLEWLSPYEPSPVRSWKMFVIELNSTQLNFYSIPSRLEGSFLAISKSQTNDRNFGQENTEFIHKTYRSLVTNRKDIEFHQLCERLEFKGFNNAEDINDECYASSASLSTKTNKGEKDKRLVRSYSLQHARIGLASDYTKKPNVLRLRLENEQFLVNFSSTQDVIDWNMGLCVGRDVALDLVLRELPRYRTVPRRRRTLGAGSSTFYEEIVTRRNRAHSDSQFQVSYGLRGRFSRFKTKLSSLSLNHLKGDHNQGQKTAQQQQVQQPGQFRHAGKPPIAVKRVPVDSVYSLSVQRELNQQGHSLPHTALFSVVGPEEEECFNILDPQANLTEDSSEEDGDDDGQNISERHGSDDENDSEVDPEAGVICPTQYCRDASIDSGLFAMSDHKWNPFQKAESKRRLLRNCLKCIKPLPFDEPWVNKLLMKPSVMSPLGQVYLKAQDIDSFRDDLITTSVGSLSVGPAFDMNGFRDFNPNRRRSSSFKENFLGLPDTSLGKITDHNLREYMVGNHSLIPNEL